MDFDQLVKDGVLKKVGRWWKVLDWTRLPEHAKRKLRAVQMVNHKVALVQFWRTTRRSA
jgi:hypothetical protein